MKWLYTLTVQVVAAVAGYRVKRCPTYPTYQPTNGSAPLSTTMELCCTLVRWSEILSEALKKSSWPCLRNTESDLNFLEWWWRRWQWWWWWCGQNRAGMFWLGMPGGSWHRWSTLSDMFDQIRLTYPPTNGIFLTMAKYLFPTTEVFCPTNANILGPQSKICSRRFNFCQICSPRLAKVGLPRIIFSQQKILFSKAGQKYCVGHTEEKYMSDLLKLISHK